MTPRVLLADGQPVRRLGVKGFLGSGDRFRVVGEASLGEEALEACRRRRPDVLLLDPCLEHPGGSVGWLCLATKLVCGMKPPRVLLFGDERELPGGEDAEGFLATSGADGFVDARAELAALAEALGRIFAGERALYVP